MLVTLSATDFTSTLDNTSKRDAPLQPPFEGARAVFHPEQVLSPL